MGGMSSLGTGIGFKLETLPGDVIAEKPAAFPEIVVEDQDIPRQLSVNARTAEFHNGISRSIGVRLDGIERNDVREYDLDRGLVTVRGRSDPLRPANIEIYWKQKPSRQVRRALRRGA